MAKFEITILGCGAPNPTPRHMTSCQVVNYQDKLYMLTTPADLSLSYAYCSDTAADERVTQAVKGCDTIYHEATYTDEYDETAGERGHSTARQAARIARQAGCRRVILGHFSAKYLDESYADHLAQAKEELDGAILADEGLTIRIP